MSIGPGPLIDAQEPKIVIPALLDHLRALGKKGQIKASWIEDVYSFILKDIEADTLPDELWIEDLLEILSKQIDSVGPTSSVLHDYYFGQRDNQWGWWKR